MKRYSAEEISGQYDKLVAFQQENGHCRVRCRNEDDPDLGGWVKFQREKYKRGSMSQDRIDLRNNIGFTWSIKDKSLNAAAADGQSIHTINLNQKWHKQYEELLEFKQQHGHRVPYCYKNGLFLGSWVKSNPYLGKWAKMQREQYKNGTMIEDRINPLNAIGFSWSVRDTAVNRPGAT
ncbi:hypothetical protein ACHAWO_009442 [Cyclotella atomus]|uniref:Helicase-associated domain-containing protein n=1 Tax=Cyclotella atomus TaxID=382360 RepID=A0ABD3MMH8_9STRA